MLGRRDSCEDIAIRAGSVELRGTLGVPPGPVGLVIFAHGSGSGRTSPRNRYVAEALRARGLATLLLDLLTESEEHIDRIDASLRFDVDKLAERLSAVTEWVQRDSHLAHLPIAYFGASTGAAAALIAAEQLPDLVRAIVSRGGRPDLAGGALRRVAAPTLFVVGGADEHVLDLNREAIERMTVPTQLAIVPGATHLFEEPGALDEVAQLAGEWIVEHIARGFEEPRRDGSAFHDRRTAGSRLAAMLHDPRGDAVVFGASRGGMLVADSIARALGAPLDVWLVRKIGMPIQPDLGMGALAEGASLVLDPAIVRWSGASARELCETVHRAASELRRRARVYRHDRVPIDVHGRTVVLVDDGIATAGTLRAAVAGARRRGAARVVVAAPVAAAEAVAQLRLVADEVVSVALPHRLMSIAAWYEDFRQVGDREVVEILADARRRELLAAQRSA